jgi:energy-coupling factor transport system substrate-specific component
MKEIFSIWGETKWVVMIALSAAVYAGTMLPFKGLVIIPGTTEIRPATVFPIIFGIMFGPAGAWGAAIGNLIGDFFGTLGPGTFPGFFGNFLLAYVPYKVWNSLVKKDETGEVSFKSVSVIAVFSLAVISGAAACALLIAWGLDLLGFVPFAPLASVITLNNSLVGLILGPVMMAALYNRTVRWDILYMPEPDGRSRGIRAFGMAGLLIGIFGGLAAGFIVSIGVYDSSLFVAGFKEATTGGLGVSMATIPFILVMLLSLFII